MSTGKSDTVLIADFGDCWLSYSCYSRLLLSMIVVGHDYYLVALYIQC